MKILMTCATLLALAWNAHAIVKIETRVANDYSLFDDIKGFEIIEKKITPTGPGSRIVIRIKGDLSTRDCSYQSHALVLQPRVATRDQDELYFASLIPVYQKQQIPLSFVPCTDIAMTPNEFQTDLEFVSHGWSASWPSRVYEVTFLGISGTIVKKMTVELAPKTGWTVELK